MQGDCSNRAACSLGAHLHMLAVSQVFPQHTRGFTILLVPTSIIMCSISESGHHLSAHFHLQEIIVPDTADAADNRKEIRKYHLKKFSIVMIVCKYVTYPFLSVKTIGRCIAC